MSQSIRALRATELKLLQERTKLQRRVEESLSGGDWQPATVHEVNERLEQVETELVAVRAVLRELERAEPASGSVR